MTELVTTEALTMSSREIAERAEKQHQHVKRDIAQMLRALNLDPSSFGRIYRDSRSRQRTEYLLPKRETLILIAGYSIPIRARIIDRWMELEAEAQSRETKSRTAPGRDLPPSGVEAHNASPHIFDSYLTRYFDQMQEKVVAPLVQIVADLVHKVDAPGNVRSVGIPASPVGQGTKLTIVDDCIPHADDMKPLYTAAAVKQMVRLVGTTAEVGRAPDRTPSRYIKPGYALPL